MALWDAETEAGSVIFGLDGELLTGQARLELIERLQVAYTHAGQAALEYHRDRVGEPHVVDLAERLADVVVTSHFANA